MTKDEKIKEVMELVELYRQKTVEILEGDGSMIDWQHAQDAIESKLRELIQ